MRGADRGFGPVDQGRGAEEAHLAERPALIISGGPDVSDELVRRSASAGHFLLCTDGGGAAAVRLGIVPDLLLGDFDSLAAEDARWLVERGCPSRRFPVEKDETDTELALDYVLKAGARAVTITGALGGRFDHALANLNLLVRFADRGLRATIDDGATQAFLLLAGESRRLEGYPGLIVSLFSAGAECRGVTLEGFKYPLHLATLALGSTLGVSNEFTGRLGTVSLADGRLFVIVAASGQEPEANL